MNTSARIETKHSLFDELIHKEACARGVLPFIRFADDTFAAAMGIDTLIGLLRSDAINRECDDGTPLLSGYDVGTLMGLVQFAAHAVSENADLLRSWAHKHFAQEDQP